MRRTIFLLPFVFAGCGNFFNQHAQMMDAMRGVMSDTAARLGEAGTGQIAAGGQVINPGLRVSGGMEYYAVAQYTGLSGQVQASMSGQLNRAVPPEVQSRIDAIWQSSTLDMQAKSRAVQAVLLDWINHKQTPTTQATHVSK